MGLLKRTRAKWATVVHQLIGNSEAPGATTVTALDKDASGYILRASGTTVPGAEAGYSKGCLFIKTDAGAGVKSVYENIGTTAVASFNLIGDVAASEITLAQGNMLVGNASGVGVAIDSSAGGNVLVGNDTTMVALDLSGAGNIGIGNGTTIVALDGSTDTQILVGNGTTMTSVALSGDATMTNAGVVTVASTTAGLSVGTTLVTGSTTVTSGAGAVAITGSIHEVTTTGTGDALTLEDGAEGQHLNVVYAAEGAGGDTAVLTPTNLAGANTTITFTDLGDAAHLLFTAGAWYFMGGEAVVA